MAHLSVSGTVLGVLYGVSLSVHSFTLPSANSALSYPLFPTHCPPTGGLDISSLWSRSYGKETAKLKKWFRLSLSAQELAYSLTRGSPPTTTTTMYSLRTSECSRNGNGNKWTPRTLCMLLWSPWGGVIEISTTSSFALTRQSTYIITDPPNSLDK